MPQDLLLNSSRIGMTTVIYTLTLLLMNTQERDYKNFLQVSLVILVIGQAIMKYTLILLEIEQWQTFNGAEILNY